MSEIATAADAYRAERARYWVRRKKVGETQTPGGSTSTFVTQVELADKTVMFIGSEDDAKAWLDRTCLRAALTKMLREPSADLINSAGSPDALTAIADQLLSPG